jgi:hypothetical protein
VCILSTTTVHLCDPPPHTSRIDSRKCHSQQGSTGQRLCRLPRSLDRELRLGNKLIDVVIIAVVNAVDAPSLPFLRAHSRCHMRPWAKLATLPAAKCLPGVLAEADRQRRDTGPSSDRSGVSHRFRVAYHANPRELRTPEISQRGWQLPVSRSRSGPRPLPRSYLREDQYSALGRIKPVVDESVARWDLLLLALRARAHARRGVLDLYNRQ